MGRELILRTIRQNRPDFKPLPGGMESSGLKSVGPLEVAFHKSLLQVGAEMVGLNDEAGAISYLETHYKEALDFEKPETWAKYGGDCPKSVLEKIGTAVLKGQFGVAENGAIWLDESNFPNWLIPFIAQKLIIKLDKKDLVKDMHEAYQNLKLQNSGFGLFVSGPSKTADIEQSLVYGAHGPKSLVVLVYGLDG